MIGPNYNVSEELIEELTDVLNAYAQDVSPQQMVCILQMFVIEASKLVAKEGN